MSERDRGLSRRGQAGWSVGRWPQRRWRFRAASTSLGRMMRRRWLWPVSWSINLSLCHCGGDRRARGTMVGWRTAACLCRPKPCYARPAARMVIPPAGPRSRPWSMDAHGLAPARTGFPDFGFTRPLTSRQSRIAVSGPPCRERILRRPHIARPRRLPEEPGLNGIVFQRLREVGLLA